MKNLLEMTVGTIQDYALFTKLTLQDLFDRSTPEEWKSGELGTIVLIPGFNEGLHFLKEIGNILNKEGHRIIYPESFSRFAKVEDLSKSIQLELDSKGITSFSIIGHSKGGLVGKLILMDRPKSVDRLISIATPWQGTYVGYLGILNLHELKPNSEVLAKLQNKEFNSKIINVRAKFDQYMIGEKDILEGVKNIQVQTVGHVRVSFSDETKEMILDEF